MASPIFAISIDNQHGRILVWVRRRAMQRLRTATFAWKNTSVDAEDVERSLDSLSDHFPKKQAREWMFGTCIRSKLRGQPVIPFQEIRITRYLLSTTNKPLAEKKWVVDTETKYTWDEVYELFLCHMRMFVTQTKEKQ